MIRRFLKNIFHLSLGCILTCLTLASCWDKPVDDDLTDMMILVYMAGDNNLSGYVDSNLKSMQHSLAKAGCDSKVVAFVDKPGRRSFMLMLDGSRTDTLKTYNENMDSSDSQTLSMFIDYVLQNYKAHSYGLLMWSHGMGWIPTDQLHYIAKNLGYVPGRDCQNVVMWHPEGRRDPFLPDTRCVAMESTGSEYTAMEIDDMADAIPDGAFNFIAFDACYMGCVEVAYELRNKCRYIISSSAEVVGRGFPYSTMTEYLAKGELLNASRDFYKYYSCQSGWSRMATISLVRTSELEGLASCMKRIMDSAELPVSKEQLEGIQFYDRFGEMYFVSGDVHFTHSVFYDLESVASAFCKDGTLMNEFRNRLARCILYEAATPYLFEGEKYEIAVREHSGLSVYVPTMDDEDSGLNDDHRNTAWGKAVGY